MCAIGEGWGFVRVPVDGNAAQFTWLAQVADPNQHGCHESADTAQHLPQSGHGFHRQQVHQHDDGSLNQESVSTIGDRWQNSAPDRSIE